MVKEHGEKRNSQRGSATVEAVVGFTAFLFAIFTILGLINFCRAQMLVSAAVDTAAKEMSQYAYFYEMSGLQKFEGKLDNNAQVGKNNINEVIGTVDNLYGSINGAVEKTQQEQANVADMLSAGEFEMQTFENAIGTIENSATGIELAAISVENAMKDVANDPLLYMRSVVALIGSETLEVAKRAVAIPLAKAFVSKHFGSDVDAKLESLGIEGGLSSMNFNLSNVFSDDKHQDIEITVLYKVKLFQIFDWVVLEANMSKVALCRAWLGGDDVIEKATGNEQPPLDNSQADGGTENGDGSQTDPSQATEPTGSTEPTVPTEPVQQEPVDITNSIWHQEDEFYEGYARDSGFYEIFRDSGLHFAEDNGNYHYALDADNKPTNTAYTIKHATDAADIEFYYGEMYKALRADQRGDEENKLGSAGVDEIVVVMYVPENITQEEMDKIYKKAKQAEKEFLDQYNLAYTTGNEKTQEYLEDTYAVVGVKIDFRKDGGNYDYSAGGNG